MKFPISISVLGLLFQGTESLFCSRPTKAIYGCRYSDYLHVSYPDPIGPVECGDIYSIKDASLTPISVTVDAILDDESLYTLLLVDTYNKILHYGAVNLDYDFLTSNERRFEFDQTTRAHDMNIDQVDSAIGQAPNVTSGGGEELTKNDMNIDQAEGVFVKYQGPDSSKGLNLKLLPYEWLFARQSEIKDVPSLEKTSGFNYGEFLQEDIIIYTTFFSSGFCAF